MVGGPGALPLGMSEAVKQGFSPQAERQAANKAVAVADKNARLRVMKSGTFFFSVCFRGNFFRLAQALKDYANIIWA